MYSLSILIPTAFFFCLFVLSEFSRINPEKLLLPVGIILCLYICKILSAGVLFHNYVGLQTIALQDTPFLPPSPPPKYR